MEDLDFSYRVYKKHPMALYAVPHARITHKTSEAARLPTEHQIYMSVTYWFYVFFKDIFQGSILNLIAFLWALSGNIVANLSGLIIKRKTKKEWWSLVYLLGAYATAFKNLKAILMGKVNFFNKTLNG